MYYIVDSCAFLQLTITDNLGLPVASGDFLLHLRCAAKPAASAVLLAVLRGS